MNEAALGAWLARAQSPAQNRLWLVDLALYLGSATFALLTWRVVDIPIQVEWGRVRRWGLCNSNAACAARTSSNLPTEQLTGRGSSSQLRSW